MTFAKTVSTSAKVLGSTFSIGALATAIVFQLTPYTQSRSLERHPDQFPNLVTMVHLAEEDSRISEEIASHYFIAHPNELSARMQELARNYATETALDTAYATRGERTRLSNLTMDEATTPAPGVGYALGAAATGAFILGLGILMSNKQGPFSEFEMTR